MSMLPAAISCRCGFQKWVRAHSISVISARPRRPSLSPSFVASSRPPAPPPTMTTRCGVPAADASVARMSRREQPLADPYPSAGGCRHVLFGLVEHFFGGLGFDHRFLVQHARHPGLVELPAPAADDD